MIRSLKSSCPRLFSSSSASLFPPSQIVDVDWLAQNINHPSLRIVDASWYMPAEKRDTYKEYLNERIPNAQFFDIDKIADKTTSLPHMLPTTKDFERIMNEEFEICNVYEDSKVSDENSDLIVIYDSAGIFSAPRVFWTFRAFGYPRWKLAVLNGGLPAWKKQQLPLEKGEETMKLKKAERQKQKSEKGGKFVADFQPGLVVSLPQVLQNVNNNRHMKTSLSSKNTTFTPQQREYFNAYQLLDARSSGRFSGQDPEPRQGVPSGHIPFATNVPFASLLVEEEGVKKFRSVSELAEIFKSKGVDLSSIEKNQSVPSIMTSCGTGVSACVLSLGLQLVGYPEERIKVYDGSWTEWATQESTPISKNDQE